MQKSHWAAIVAAAVLLILGFVVARALYFGASATATYEPPEREYSEVSREQASPTCTEQAGRLWFAAGSPCGVCRHDQCA